MLNSVLIVGVPMVALLAAAFYVFTRAQRGGPQGGGSGDAATAPQFSDVMAPRPSSSKCRQRRPTPGQGGQGQGDGHSSSDSPDSGFVEEEQCKICFENRVRVRLYPCKHRDICKGCVHKLLFTSRQCPFCRSRIDGYEEAGSSDLFSAGRM